MNDVHVTSFVFVNTSSVILEGVRNSDPTSYGSTLIYFLHHVLLSGHRSELINLMHPVLFRYKALATPGITCLTNVDWGTRYSIVMATSLVDRASLISYVVFVHELEGREGLTTVTTVIVHGARDDDLR